MYDPAKLSTEPILSNLSVGYKIQMPTANKPLKKLKPGMGLYQVLHWPDKAPDKSKPWAVVNLQTQDVNGRWHSSKEEALAQARALYARLGDKARVHSETLTYFCFADPAVLLSEDGVKWVEAIAPKTYKTPGYGEVVITPEKIDNFVSSILTKVRGQEVAINYEHGVDPAKGNKAAGWIRDARKNAKGNLELAVDFTENAKQEIINKEWKYFSLEWDDSWEHPDGVIYKDVVMGGGLTNRPVAKGLMPINFSELVLGDDIDGIQMSEWVKSEVENSQFEFAVWTTAYVNSLPDSSFLWIGPDGAKHLPYKDKSGKIDLPHLRNAAARLNQVKGMPADVAARLKTKIQKMLGTNNMAELLVIDEQTEYERSDPGTNAPIYDDPVEPDPGVGQRVPRVSGDPSDDPAIGGGWRRITPPPQDVFKFTEPQAQDYLKTAAQALSSYIADEQDPEDIASAQCLLDEIAELLGKDLLDSMNIPTSSTSMGRTMMYAEYTSICSKAKKFFEAKLATNDKTLTMDFSESEAIGYLTSAKTGLNRVHTNAANALIDRIEVILNKDFRTRSFNELQGLVTETRAMLRGETKTNSVSKTTPSKGGNAVGELTEKDLRELRNVLDVDDDGRILEAVKVRFGELHALRDAVSASEQERVFAEQYPQFYEQHQHLLERDRRNTAKTFAESVQKVRRNEGYGLKDTRQGLSVATLEKVAEMHMKFAENKATVEDFEEVVKCITNGGIVQFGEIGSSSNDSIPEIDVSSASGVATARKVFAEVVSKIQRENPDMPYLEAVNEASKKHPDLADTYKVTLPA